MNYLRGKLALTLTKTLSVIASILIAVASAEAVTFNNSIATQDGERIYSFDLEFGEEVTTGFSGTATPTAWTFTSVTDGDGEEDFSGGIPLNTDLLAEPDWALTGFLTDPGVWSFEEGLPSAEASDTDVILFLTDSDISVDFLAVASQGFFSSTDTTTGSLVPVVNRFDVSSFSSSQADTTAVPESSGIWGIVAIGIFCGMVGYRSSTRS